MKKSNYHNSNKQNESCPFDKIHMFLLILYYNFKLSKQNKILTLYFL